MLYSFLRPQTLPYVLYFYSSTAPPRLLPPFFTLFIQYD